MITLEVEPYCEYCMEFEPAVQKPDYVYMENEKIYISDTVIRCKFRERCERIREHLRGE